MDVARALVNVVTLALASAIVIAAARGSTTVDFAVYLPAVGRQRPPRTSTSKPSARSCGTRDFRARCSLPFPTARRR